MSKYSDKLERRRRAEAARLDDDEDRAQDLAVPRTVEVDVEGLKRDVQRILDIVGPACVVAKTWKQVAKGPTLSVANTVHMQLVSVRGKVEGLAAKIGSL